MPNNDDLAVKREEARRAMEGDERRLKRETEEAELSKKRQAAVDAMQGYERRIKHEMEIKAVREKEILRQKMEEEKRRQEEEEKLRKEREEAARRANEEEREREREARLSGVRQSEQVIEEVVSRPEARINAIHTIKSDIADAAKTGKLSLAKIMAKEQERKNLVYTGDVKRQAIATVKKHKWVTLGIALVLCFLVVYVAYFWRVPATDYEIFAPRDINTDPLVFVEEENEIDLHNMESNRLLQEILKKKNAPAKKIGAIANIYFVRTSINQQTAATQKELIGLSGFLKAANINLPEEFTKYLSEKFMLGTYKRTPAGIFLVFRVRDYEKAAANLISSENGILGSLLIPLAEISLARDFSEKSFHDKVVKNLNTRVMTGAKGKTVAIYGFVDNRTIVIAEDEETFIKAVTAYTTPKPVVR